MVRHSRAHAETIAEQVASLSGQLEAATHELEVAQGRLKAAQGKLASVSSAAQGDTNAATAAKEAAQAEIERLQQQLAERDAAVAHAEAAAQKVQDESAALRRRVETAEAAVQAAAESAAAAQAEAAQSKAAQEAAEARTAELAGPQATLEPAEADVGAAQLLHGGDSTELAPPEEHAALLATDATQLAGAGREAEGEAEAVTIEPPAAAAAKAAAAAIEAAERRAAVAAAAAATRLDEQAKHFESEAARLTARLEAQQIEIRSQQCEIEALTAQLEAGGRIALQPPGAAGDGAAGDEAAGDDGVGNDAPGHSPEEEELLRAEEAENQRRVQQANEAMASALQAASAAAAAVAAQFDSAAAARLQDAASKLVERTDRLQAAERKIGVIRTKLRERSAGRRRQLPQQDRASSPVRMGSASRRGSPAQVAVRSPASRRASRSSSPEVMHGEVVPEEEDEVLRAWREEDGELKGLRDELQREVDGLEGVAQSADVEVAAVLASRSASPAVDMAAGSAGAGSAGSAARPASALRTASPPPMGVGGPPEAVGVVEEVSVEQLQLLQGKLSDALDARRAAEEKAMEQAGRLGAAQAEAAELGSRLREQQVLAGGASAAAAELRQKLCMMVAKQAEAMVVRQATLLDALDAAMAPHLSEDVPSYFSALVSSGRARLDRSRQLVETAAAESKAGGGAEGGVARPVTELVHDLAAQLGSTAGALQTVVLGAARAAAEAAAEPQMSTLPPLEYGQGDVLLQKRLHAVRKDLDQLAQRAGASSAAARAQHEVHTSPHISPYLPISPHISRHDVHTPRTRHARTVPVHMHMPH